MASDPVVNRAKPAHFGLPWTDDNVHALNDAIAILFQDRIIIGDPITSGSALTPHGVLLAEANSTIVSTLVGASNTVLHGNTGTDPTFSNVVNADIANATIDLTAKVTGVLPIANGGTATSTQFTAGSVIFAGASGVYTQDNANLFWDNTAKQLVTPKIVGGSNVAQQLTIQSTSGVGTTDSIAMLVGTNGSVTSGIFTHNGANGELLLNGALANFTVALFVQGAGANCADFQNAIGATANLYLSPSRTLNAGSFWDRWIFGAGQIAANDFGIGNSDRGFTALQILGGASGGRVLFPLAAGVSFGADSTSLFKYTAVEATGLAVRDSGNTTLRSLSMSNMGLAQGGTIFWVNQGGFSSVADGGWAFSNNANTSSLQLALDHIYFQHNSGGNAITANGAGIFLISNEAQTIGFTLNGGAANTLKVRNIANNADAAIQFAALTQSGKTTTYNNIATVSGGVPSELATIDTTGLTANVAASTLYAVPASGEGLYRVSAYVVETTAGSVSSTLPNIQIVFTDKDSNTSVTMDATPIFGVAGIGQTGALTANTIGTASSGVVDIYVKASTTIQYQTVNYASNLAGMTYAIHLKLEAL